MQIGLESPSFDTLKNDTSIERDKPAKQYSHWIIPVSKDNYSLERSRFNVAKKGAFRVCGLQDYSVKVDINGTFGGDDSKVEVKVSGSASDNHGNRVEASVRKDSDGNGDYNVSSHHSKESDKNSSNGKK